jgi:hypothetical protein
MVIVELRLDWLSIGSLTHGGRSVGRELSLGVAAVRMHVGGSLLLQGSLEAEEILEV